MAAVLDDSEFDFFELATDVTGGRYFTARDTARTRVDLRRLVERYAKTGLTETGDGYKSRCFLPSAVGGFDGTCAAQDESDGHPGQNLSITLAEDGTHWRWRCFSCGRGQTRDGSRPGDVVDLVTHAEGFHVNEGNTGSLKALRFVLRLANLDHVLDGLDKPRQGRAPVDLGLVVDSPVAARKEQVKVEIDKALELNKRARKHWQVALQAGAASMEARTYLSSRGVTPGQIKRYAIGYARPKFGDLVNAIEPKLYATGAATGMIKLSKNGKQIDSLRDRIMFPYCYPARGARPLGVYGFAGRNLVGVDPYTGEDIEGFEHHGGRPPPKWHNSKNVEGVWKKREDMLGVWQSLKTLRETGILVACEGAFDMLAFDRLGVAAWALVGKEFTVAHALLVRSTFAQLERACVRVVYACDGESVGRKAVIKFAASMLAAGFNIAQLGVIDSDDGQDPASTEPDTLAERTKEPLAVLSFLSAQLSAGALEQADLRPLLSAAPRLGAHFGLETSRPKSVAVADASVVDALAQEPELAQYIALEEAQAYLSACPGFAALPTDGFGEETRAGELPRTVQRAWLHLVRDASIEDLAVYDRSKPEGKADLSQWSRGRLLLARKVRHARRALEKNQQVI